MNVYALQDGQDQTVISAKPIQVALNKELVQNPGNVSVKTIPWVNIVLFKTNPFHWFLTCQETLVIVTILWLQDHPEFHQVCQELSAINWAKMEMLVTKDMKVIFVQ